MCQELISLFYLFHKWPDFQAKVRFSEDIKDLQKNSDHSPLFKHQNNYHPGGSNKWHFSITSTFRDPLTRQVNEAVRISKLPPS